jgi:hypothetical protein
MPTQELPPDPDSIEKWRQMPQNQPSKDSLPPVVFRPGWILGFVVLTAILIVLGLLLQRGLG